MNNSFVYGDAEGNLIFVRRTLAERLSALRSGFASWAEARASLEKSTLDEMTSTLSEWEIDVPSDSEPFDLDIMPGYIDGDWPEWPAKVMLQELPNEIIEKFGRIEDSVLNGEFLVLQPELETEILEELQARGWECVRDDAMVLRASGF